MLILACVAAYFTVGVAAACLGTWFHPEVYTDKWDGGPATTLTVMFWPIATPFALAFMAVHATARAKDKKVSVRAEIEKELVDAKREIEELLRRKP